MSLVLLAVFALVGILNAKSALVSVLSVSPRLVVAPFMVRLIKRRSINAVDTLLRNMASLESGAQTRSAVGSLTSH